MATSGGWRYLAQRMTGNGSLGDFVDINVPLSNVQIEEVLSGHNSMSGTITPEVQRLKGPDGKPLLEEWGTAIWAEDADGVIRGGGMINHMSFTGPNWEIECIDLSCALIDLPYTESKFFINVDPLDIFREIWRYAQYQPKGNYGITFDATTSPILLGGDLVQHVEFDVQPDVSATPPSPDPAPAPVTPPPVVDPNEAPPVPLPATPNPYGNNSLWRDAGVKAMKAVGWDKDKVDKALGKWLGKDAAIADGSWKGLDDRERLMKDKTIEKIGPPPNPPNGYYIAPAPYVATPDPVIVAPPADPVEGNPPPDPDENPAPEEQAQRITWEYDAYKLAWYMTHNLDDTVNDLASNTPFDWFMTHYWYDEQIRHHIRIGYPSIGRRSDLRFVIGENVKIIPTVERDGTRYANEILFLGAGEGSAQVMARAFRREDDKVRRVAVVSDPSVQDWVVAQNRANAELAKRFSVEEVTDIVLHDHPHAPMGSVDLGDEILLEGETGWADLEIWVRVVGRTLSPDSGNAMTLSVIRTDRLG